MQMWVLLLFFGWFFCILIASFCMFFAKVAFFPAELRRLTSWLKMPPLRRIPCNGLIVWQHDTTFLYTCFFHISDSGGAATWFHRKKKGWLLGCSGETNGKRAVTSDNQLDDCRCQHWTFQGPKTTSWSGFNGKFGGSRWNEGRKVQGFTQKLDQKSTRPGNSMDTYVWYEFTWCRGCTWGAFLNIFCRTIEVKDFCQCWWKKTTKLWMDVNSCCKFLVKFEATEEDEESEDGMFLVDLNSEFTMEYDMFVPT